MLHEKYRELYVESLMQQKMAVLISKCQLEGHISNLGYPVYLFFFSKNPSFFVKNNSLNFKRIYSIFYGHTV